MPEVLIKNQALEKNIETFVNWFYAKHPADARFMEEMVKSESAFLINRNGMSKEGCFMTKAKLPQNVYSIFKTACRMALGIDDFWRDYDNVQLFFKVWRNAAIKRHPTKILDLGGLNTTSLPA